MPNVAEPGINEPGISEPGINESSLIDPARQSLTTCCPACQAVYTLDPHIFQPATVAPQDLAQSRQNSFLVVLLQGLLLLTLMLAVPAQIGWFQHQSLAPASSASHFKILARYLQQDAQHPDALQLSVSFQNISDQPREWPQLQLALTDNQGNLLARRLFRTDEYHHATAPFTPLDPQQITSIQLYLADPGIQASGFEIELF